MATTSNIYNEIICKQLPLGCDQLCILSSYATSNMASWLIKSLEKMNISVSLIVGMTVLDGLSVSVHKGFTDLVARVPSFQCSYVFDGPPVHYNLYIWLKNGRAAKAFASTAHFTQSCFIGSQQDYFEECDPDEAYKLYEKVESSTIYCNHAEVEEAIILRSVHPILDAEKNAGVPISGYELKSVSLSLLARGGETGKKSGLNWGQRKGREKNQAYISLPAKIRRTGFFPLEGQHFTVLTDDHHQLTLRVEQENDKAITTPMRNADLGEYFRNRLGLSNGAYVTRRDLEKYGRTDVTFFKFDDEQYYMDFSV